MYLYLDIVFLRKGDKKVFIQGVRFFFLISAVRNSRKKGKINKINKIIEITPKPTQMLYGRVSLLVPWSSFLIY